jgi:RsbRD-like negative regulator of sigma factor
MATGSMGHQQAVGSADLADYLATRKEVLILQWMVAARKSQSIPSDSLTRLELLDHVPKIFDTVTEALRGQRSEQAMERVQEAAARHTIVRWVQKYDLRAVLREVSLLRAEFIAHVHAFADANPHLGTEVRLFNSQTIHRILDDVLMDATETFLKLGAHANG